MRSIAVALGALLLLAVGESPGWHTFSARDVRVRVPDGWSATKRPLTPVTAPAELFAAASYALPRRPIADGCRPSGALARLQPSGAFVYAIEVGSGPLRGFPPRPRRFAATRLTSSGCFGRGYRFDFRQAGEDFQVQVDFGRAAPASARVEALELLDSLTVAR